MLDLEQQIQEDQYNYPYHYIPKWDETFSQVQHWSWGYRYLGGLSVVLDQLTEMEVDSLLDVGCGDGRFLYEVHKRYPGADLLGVDYSQKSILLARAMSKDIRYREMDILNEELDRPYSIATAIEVLEHIHPSQLAEFVGAVADSLTKGGKFIVTVPHENKKVSEKHYQHFSSDKLEKLLSPDFQILEFIPFDMNSKVLLQLSRLIGGQGNHFVVTNSRLNNLFFRIYRNNYLYTEDEAKCLRIAAVCSKR